MESLVGLENTWKKSCAMSVTRENILLAERVGGREYSIGSKSTYE